MQDVVITVGSFHDTYTCIFPRHIKHSKWFGAVTGGARARSIRDAARAGAAAAGPRAAAAGGGSARAGWRRGGGAWRGRASRDSRGAARASSAEPRMRRARARAPRALLAVHAARPARHPSLGGHTCDLLHRDTLRKALPLFYLLSVGVGPASSGGRRSAHTNLLLLDR